MPLYVVRSAPVRSPDPAAPIQWTSGQPGSAEAVAAERPTTAAPVTAAAQATVARRRDMNPNPSWPLPGPYGTFIASIAACVTGVTAVEQRSAGPPTVRSAVQRGPGYR